MLEACMNPRDRALIAVLRESGCRVGELGNMMVRDVELTEDEGSIMNVYVVIVNPYINELEKGSLLGFYEPVWISFRNLGLVMGS